MSSRIEWRRVSAEAVAIFGAVFLGLVAEDWRQTRIERREAQNALTILRDDLRADSAGLERLTPPLRSHVAVGVWAQDAWTREVVDLDSVGIAMRRLLFVNDPRFRRAGYTTLLDGDRLGLIENDSLRLEIVAYFEEVQPSTRFWIEGHADQRLKQTVPVLSAYFRLPPGRNEGSLWPVVSGPIEMSRSWRELREDNRVFNEIIGLGWWAEIALTRIDLAIEANVALRSRIDRELGVRREPGS